MSDYNFWFKRFIVSLNGSIYLFEDRLSSAKKYLHESIFNGLTEEEKYIEFFRQGFLKSVLSRYQKNLIPQIDGNIHTVDWQFPCITESSSYVKHLAIMEPFLDNKSMHTYLGLPWASLIDAKILDSKLFNLVKTKNSGYAGALLNLNVKLKIHTVCQHIFWERCIPIWKEIGITDVWLSHMPSYVDSDLPFKIHPWALYAVNVEDPDRREGIEIGKDPASKTLMASFIGAHSEGYVSDIRLKLRQFSEQPGFLIRVTDKWHFEDVVYKHQVQGLPLEENYVIGDSVREYNAVLSDSIFALCPSGAGPNSIRLWEALAVGSIPVLLGKFPVLPRGG